MADLTRLPAENLPSMSIVPSTPMEMLGRAVQMGASPETLEKLLALQERWERSQARRAYDKAIAAAKAELKPIKKNKAVSFGAGKASYKHADLAEIERAVVPVLSKFGLSYRFRTAAGKPGEPITVTCIISHEDGYSEENSLPGPADTSGSKNALQAIGSAITYLQRYTLVPALGLAASDDDDGASGGGTAISSEQFEELQRLIVQTGSDIKKFIALFQDHPIERLEDLPASQFQTAKAILAQRQK